MHVGVESILDAVTDLQLHPKHIRSGHFSGCGRAGHGSEAVSASGLAGGNEELRRSASVPLSREALVHARQRVVNRLD